LIGPPDYRGGNRESLSRLGLPARNYAQVVYETLRGGLDFTKGDESINSERARCSPYPPGATAVRGRLAEWAPPGRAQAEEAGQAITAKRSRSHAIGVDACRLDHGLEHFPPDRAPTGLDVLDQSSVRTTLCGAIGL
jgi:hypothetical protein